MYPITFVYFLYKFHLLIPSDHIPAFYVKFMQQEDSKALKVE